MASQANRQQAPYFLDELAISAAKLRANPEDTRLRDDMDRGIRETDLEIQFAAWLAAGDDENLGWALRRVAWFGLDAPPVADFKLTMDERALIFLGLHLEEIAVSHDEHGVVELLAGKGYRTDAESVPDLLANARHLDQPLGRAWARVIGEVHSRVDAALREQRRDPVASGLSRFIQHQFSWVREAQAPDAFRRVRVSAGLKSSTLAGRMGLSYATVYGFETGQFPIPFRHRRRLDQIAHRQRRQAA